MRKFFIVTNAKIEDGQKHAKELEEILTANGCICTGNVLTRHDAHLGYMYSDPKLVPFDTEIILVLGGDGTFIHAAKDLIKLNIPIYGINYGTLGYLTEIEAGDFENVLGAFKADKYTIEDRMLLRGEIIRDGKVVAKDKALNDIVLGRGSAMGILEYDLIIDGHFLNAYTADGVIVSTPTGSTGYNLSAGGPVVQPTAEILLITPLCAHTLNSRSLVFSAKTVLEIKVKGFHNDKDYEMIVSFDGDENYRLQKDDIIRVRKSKQSIKVIKTQDTSFVELLGKKMR